MSVDSIKRKETLVYIVLWLIVVLLYILHTASDHAVRSETLLTVRDLAAGARTLFPLILLFALNNFLLIPRLLMRYRVWQYTLVIILLVAMILMYYWYNYSLGLHAHHNPPLSGHPYPPPPRNIIPMPLVNDVIYCLMVVVVNIAVSLTAHQIVLNLERERLVAANTTSQLRSLKAQINPHFYMNMLNNIHGLIDLDAERAKDMVFDMSRLMQYMLYDASKPLISLSAEIKFLEDYIRLMRQRYPDGKVTVTCRMPSGERLEHISIPPLMFLVFIENAFKHGIDYRQWSYIDVTMDVDGGCICFACVNSRHPAEPHVNRGGVGLDNIRTRLAMMYGDEAVLDIDDTHPDHYSVNLTIPIYDHSHSHN